MVSEVVIEEAEVVVFEVLTRQVDLDKRDCICSDGPGNIDELALPTRPPPKTPLPPPTYYFHHLPTSSHCTISSSKGSESAHIYSRGYLDTPSPISRCIRFQKNRDKSGAEGDDDETSNRSDESQNSAARCQCVMQ